MDNKLDDLNIPMTTDIIDTARLIHVYAAFLSLLEKYEGQPKNPELIYHAILAADLGRENPFQASQAAMILHLGRALLVYHQEMADGTPYAIGGAVCHPAVAEIARRLNMFKP